MTHFNLKYFNNLSFGFCLFFNTSFKYCGVIPIFFAASFCHSNFRTKASSIPMNCASRITGLVLECFILEYSIFYHVIVNISLFVVEKIIFDRILEISIIHSMRLKMRSKTTWQTTPSFLMLADKRKGTPVSLWVAPRSVGKANTSL